jgi:O-antigen ligase
VSVAPNATAILIGLAWIGTIRSRRDWAAAVYQRHRKLLVSGVLLVLWTMLSALWARDPDLVWADEFWQLPVALAIFAVLIGSFPSRRWAVLLAGAFVAGATLSVLVGLASDGLNPAGDAIASAGGEGRLQGANGDPNYLAAGCVPAVAIAAALIGLTRNVMLKWGLTAVMAVLVAGLAASESRGGFIAAIVAVGCAVVLNKRQRARVVGLIAVAVSVTAMYFVAYPETFERVTQVDGGGNGRTDLWYFATRMAEEHPIAGGGYNNYALVAKDYVHEPGVREFSFLVTETPHVAHSVYLQLLAETGVVGLVLFLIVVAGCLRAALAAARRFDDLDELPMAGLARAVFVAMAGMLTASFFISNLTDRRMWILFALGPILLALASRPQPEPDA